MNSRPTLSFVCFAVATCAACSAYTLDSLEPAAAPLATRLLPLHVGLGENEVVRAEALRAVTLQTDFATVFRRDLEANVFEPDDERWGYAEFRLAYDNDAITGAGVALIALNVVTLLVPTVLGAPLVLRERTLQAEIVIYNSRRVEVAKYVITGTARYRDGLYTRDVRRRAGIDAAKDVMDQLKVRLNPDVGMINDRLRTIGAVR
jgi:hypothetical protein